MRVSRHRRLTVLSALLIFASCQAYALDVPPPGPANDEHVIIDSTLDVWRGGISYDFNSTFAPFGSIYETGFRFRLTPNYSWFQFKIPDTPGTASGQSVGLDIMPGIGIVVPKVSFIALVGP